MKRYIKKAVFSLLLILILPWSASATVEWQVEQSIKLERKPVDVAMSARGTYLFALTDDGIVHAYDAEGNLKGEINAGKGFDAIACGPEENIILLKSRKKREIQKIAFEFVEKIDTEGSPYRGKADAPVVIAVFTDYQ